MRKQRVSIWAQWEDDYIAQHYARGKTADIAKHLQRHPQQVRTRANALGVQKAPGERAKRVGEFDAAMDALLRQLYASHTNNELAALLDVPRKRVAHRGNTLKLRKSPETLARTAIATGKHNTGHAGQFQKGHATWNKGISGYSIAIGRGHYKPGHRPPRAVPVGTERWIEPPSNRPNNARYLKRKVAEPNVWQMAHRWLWEQHHGAIPAGWVVRFIDGDSTNITIDNLHCLPRADLAISSGARVPVELVHLHKLNKQLAHAIKNHTKGHRRP